MVDEVAGVVRDVIEYASDESSWISVKKELLRQLTPDSRALFSTRDPTTKKQRTNDFELEVMALWRALGGRELLLIQ